MDFEQFSKINAGWRGLFGAYGREKDMIRNLEIANDVASKFYNHYDMSNMKPQKGDIIEFVNYNTLYKNANVESVDRFGLMYVCENGSTFTDGECFSTSGGSFARIHESNFEFVGYEHRKFWTWGCHGSGANQGIYFTIKVKRFRQKNIHLTPENYIYIGNKYYTENGYGKVQILDDSVYGYIIQEFKTIKAFKAFAEYVGLTYHKLDSYKYVTEQFVINGSFNSLEQLPKGVKPFYGLSNGEMVTCYAYNDGKAITLYRPNPNYKDIYKPLDIDGYRKYSGNPLGI